MMDKEHVKVTFDNLASEYDEFIAKVNPRYHEQHDVIASLLPFTPDQKLTVLDLGCGTGSLSQLVLDRFPNAHVHAVDSAENMINAFKTRFQNKFHQITTHAMDFDELTIDATFDLVLAGLSVHHLSHERKKALFKTLVKKMNAGGIFVLRDLFAAPNDHLKKLYREHWTTHMQKSDLDVAQIFHNHETHDEPAPLFEEMQWLKEAGFSGVTTPWVDHMFALVCAWTS